MQFEGYINECMMTEAGPEHYMNIEFDVFKLRLLHSIMGIGGEAGELVDYLKKCVFYQREVDVDIIVEELGDMMWYVAILLDNLGVDFEDVLEANIAKLRTRYAEKWTAEESEERDPEAEIEAVSDAYSNYMKKLQGAHKVTEKDDNERITDKDDQWLPICSALVFYAAAQGKDIKSFTVKQIQALQEPVPARVGMQVYQFPSPNELFVENPKFKEWLSEIIPLLPKFQKRINAANLVMYARAYDYKKIGWLEYAKSHESNVSASEIDTIGGIF